MELAWEVGEAVIVALLLWLAAGSILAGMCLAGVGMAGVWVWRGLYASLAALRALRALRSHPGRYEPPQRRTPLPTLTEAT
jgi:hypothetical protein